MVPMKSPFTLASMHKFQGSAWQTPPYAPVKHGAKGWVDDLDVSCALYF